MSRLTFDPSSMQSVQAGLARLALLITALACPVHAIMGQEVTGSIRGRVLNPVGQPAAAVRVQGSGAQLLGVREVITDDNGYFVLQALPPGEYTVRIRRLGMRSITIDSVRVVIGRTTPLEIPRLTEQATQIEEVRITAGRHTLDPGRTDIGATLDSRDYDALPGDRDYKSILSILPHVNQSHRGDPVNSAGATGLENMYFIDGVNVTAPLKGESGTSLPRNFVRHLEVKSGGFEAQFGKALGAVVNAVTYSGTNDLEVEVFSYGTTSQLALPPKAEPTLRETRRLTYDVGGRIGGPILRDQLWYSAAYNPQIESAHREIQGLGVFEDRRASHIFAAKLNWNAFGQTSIEVSAFGDPTIHESVTAGPFMTGLTPLQPDPFLSRVESGGHVVMGRATSFIGGGLLEGSVSRSRGRDHRLAASAPSLAQPLFLDLVQRTVSGGSGFLSRADIDRSTVAIKTHWSIGRHSLLVGFEYEDASAARNLYQSGSRLIRRLACNDACVDRGDTARYVAHSEAAEGVFRNKVPTGYVQNAWQLNDRFTLKTGVRWSSQTLTSASGLSAQRFPDEWQPRLGLVWQLGENRRERLTASYGRFYQQEPLNLSTVWYVDYPLVFYTYGADPRTSNAQPYDTLDASTYESDWSQSIPGLQAEHSDEFTLGYDRLVGRSAVLTLRAVRRDLRSSFQWGIDPDNPNFWVLGTPGEGDFAFLPRPKRQYTAFEVSTVGSWRETDYRASYVLSRNWGNYAGLFYSDLGVANPGLAGTFFLPDHAVNTTGLLPNDRTHVLKASGSHPFGNGLNAGASLSWQSGSPLNVFGLNEDGRLILVEPRGSAGRTPSLWDVNLRFAYDVRSAGKATSRLILDILHVANPQRPTRLGERRYLDPTLSNEDPSFGKPLTYQPPMTIRLGGEVRH